MPAAAYDEHYFRHVCAGSEEWEASGGTQPAAVYAGCLARAGLRAGEVVLDIGTGRGELLAVAVRSGAARAIGVEYSPAAVALAERTIAACGVGDRAEVLGADARALPVEDECADLVTLLDVVEHLVPAELSATLAEARRVLRPGGRLLVHTMPTRTIYDVTYRIQRSLSGRRRRHWPPDPRNDWERRLHVNEQTRSGLRRSLRRAGFSQVRVSHGGWVHDDFVPDVRARRLYAALARHRLTASLGAADLWGEARR